MTYHQRVKTMKTVQNMQKRKLRQTKKNKKTHTKTDVKECFSLKDTSFFNFFDDVSLAPVFFTLNHEFGNEHHAN
jgi:hypothetical protein